jgi:hypothetical protein
MYGLSLDVKRFGSVYFLAVIESLSCGSFPINDLNPVRCAIFGGFSDICSLTPAPSLQLPSR